jgi:hypothetical protein
MQPADAPRKGRAGRKRPCPARRPDCCGEESWKTNPGEER